MKYKILEWFQLHDVDEYLIIAIGFNSIQISLIKNQASSLNTELILGIGSEFECVLLCMLFIDEKSIQIVITFYVQKCYFFLLYSDMNVMA